MFTIVYKLRQRPDQDTGTGTIGKYQYEIPSYEMRISSRQWKTREAAQYIADGTAKDRMAFVIEFPSTYTTEDA